MWRLGSFALIIAVTVVGSASAAPIVGLDFIVVTNGAPVFGDGFDNGVLDQPPWTVAAGAPGPESGTTLTMHGGDTILTGLGGLDPQLDTLVQAQFDLTDFPAGTSASLLLFGDDPGESLSLSLVPGGAFLIDSVAGLVGSDSVAMGPTAALDLTLGTDGVVTAVANGTTIFSDSLSFGPLAGAGFAVVPEPSTLAMLGLGAILLARRRRR